MSPRTLPFEVEACLPVAVRVVRRLVRAASNESRAGKNGAEGVRKKEVREQLDSLSNSTA